MISENFLPFIMPLLGLGLLAALIFVHRDDKYPLAQKCLLIALGAFVIQSAYVTIERREKISLTSLVIAGEGANLAMRSYMAIDLIRTQLPEQFTKLKPIMGGGDDLLGEFSDQAEHVLREALKEAPDSAYLQIRLALVLAKENFADNKAEIDKLLNALQKSEDQHVVEYSGIIRKLYFGTVQKSDQANYAHTIETLMPLSWYRDTTLLRLYKATGDQKAYDSYMQKTEEKAADWVTKMAALIILFPVIFFVGLVLLFIQLGVLAAKRQGPAKLLPLPGIDDMQAIITVLIAWMANEVIVSTLMSTMGIKLSGLSATAVSALLAVTYLLSNGPIWFYIYWFAFRRKKISLLAGLKISQPAGNLLTRIMWGVSAWMAAIPLVLVAFALSNAFFHTHGSQSPVVAMLVQVARSANMPAIFLFYISLAVLAPLCEEPLFRGLLYQGLRSRIGVFAAAVMSAFLFAALHLDSGTLVPLFALGLVFAFIFEKTGSLVPAMIAHGLWNGANFTCSLLVSSW